MSCFYCDISSGINIRWDELISDIKNIDQFNPYCKRQNFYDIFKDIIVSLLYDKEIILLDGDFSDSEITSLIGDINISSCTEKLEISKIISIESKDDLIEAISKQRKAWSLTIFTSGTTGLPKKVKHSFQSLTRFVKQKGNRSCDIWGYAYNPTHMAGLQVFFQALINGNSIVRLFGLSKDEIMQSISANKVTHISATPTFYRLLLPEDCQYPSVIRLTSGGEKFDVVTSRKMQAIFPNAKITNVYASTEAGSIFASDGDVFFIKPEIRNLVKIEENEIVIHRELMGDMNSNDGDWYKTGDIIEVSPEDPWKFRFVSRKNEMISVGGYKVNPNEVEDNIRDIEGIRNVRVFAKKNSLIGNIICCEVVSDNSDLTEQTIRQDLGTRLQDFKIPRIIRFVDEINVSRTGKVKRT